MKKDKAYQIFTKVIEQFKELRLSQGLSHQRLAEKTGITRPAISHIESGRRKPSLVVAIKLAHALDKNFSDIVRVAEKN